MWRIVTVVIVAAAATAAAGPLQTRELMRTRCYVSANEDAIACPQFSDVRQRDADASWLVVTVSFADDRMFETLIVHVGRDYGGTVAFEPPVGIGAVRRRFARGKFVAAPAAREVKVQQWLPTQPRSRVVWRDESQLDAALEVDCGKGRLVQDALNVSGQRFFAHVLRGRVALMGRNDSGDASIRITEVNHQIADPAALCAAAP